MNQGARLIFFLVTVALCVAVIVLWPDYVTVSPTIKVILFASLITAAFSGALIEHFFTKPTDVVANATAALLLLLPAEPDLALLGSWFWAIIGYYALMIAASSTSIILYSFANEDAPGMLHASRMLKEFSIRFGTFKLIYGSAFFSTLFLYIDKSSTVFLVLAIYFLAIILIEPSRSLRGILGAIRADDFMAVGDVFGVQSRNVFLAKLRPNRRALTRFQSVYFRYKLDDVPRDCLIVDSYMLNDEQWVKIVPIGQPAQIPRQPEPNVIYHSSFQQTNNILEKIIGLITESSSIGLIRFEYAPRNQVFQGKLVEVQIANQKVLYQIVQGTTAETVLEHKNKSGSITGEAAQLGVWNGEKQRFERFGWVPEINSLVVEPSEPPPVQIAEGDLRLGTIPGTNYPVIMNMDDAISHHLAIFGVTGSGKSVFSRWLLQQYINHGVLVICVDNTQEYQKKLPSEIWTQLVSDDNNESIKTNVNRIAREMEKFPNQRDQNVLRTSEIAAQNLFSQSVDLLGAMNGKVGILNLPDLSSTIEGLEYIRLFFSAIFQKAREGAFNNRQVCLVLEEAHTLVPEWNFNSGDEKRSQALVNTISQIALQGRKYNVGLIVIGQRTANVAKTVLTQCNSVIAFQQFDPTGLDFFSHYMGKDFAQGLSVLQSRRAVAVGKAFAAGVPLIFEVPNIDETSGTEQPSTSELRETFREEIQEESTPPSPLGDN